MLAQEEYEPFAQELRPLVRATDRLSALVVAGNGGQVDYAWSRREARLPAGGPDVRLQTDILEHEPWERQFDERIESANGGEFYVSAAYETLEQEVVFRTLRDALLAILAFALLVLIVLISSLRIPPQTKAGPETPVSNHPLNGSEINESSREQPTFEPPRKTHDDHGTESPSGAEQDTATHMPPLVSPNSGLSFENHLPRRLSLELERAAENNLDLSLLIVRIMDVEGTPVTPHLLGTVILEQFPFEDLTFEYSPAGACIILTGIDLDTALRKAERLRSVVRRHDLGDYRVRAGASSRNGRLVESDRLIREAHEAFGRSDSQSFAVGFRPDPDRYRSYIASKTDGMR